MLHKSLAAGVASVLKITSLSEWLRHLKRARKTTGRAWFLPGRFAIEARPYEPVIFDTKNGYPPGQASAGPAVRAQELTFGEESADWLKTLVLDDH